jgi:uncharacterized protein (TIGR03067 family)
MLTVAHWALLFAAPLAAQDEAQKELARLQGDWVVVSAEANGQKLPADITKDFTLTLKGNRFTTRRGSEQPRSGTYKVDLTKKPHTMDVTLEAGPDKGKTQLAIYVLEKDTLQICSGPPDSKDRPADFETKGKKDLTVLHLKRKS